MGNSCDTIPRSREESAGGECSHFLARPLRSSTLAPGHKSCTERQRVGDTLAVRGVQASLGGDFDPHLPCLSPPPKMTGLVSKVDIAQKLTRWSHSHDIHILNFRFPPFFAMPGWDPKDPAVRDMTVDPTCSSDRDPARLIRRVIMLLARSDWG